MFVLGMEEKEYNLKKKKNTNKKVMLDVISY